MSIVSGGYVVITSPILGRTLSYCYDGLGSLNVLRDQSSACMNNNNNNFRGQTVKLLEIESIEEAPSGLLDGVTIFRFAHIWKSVSSGGVEAYLWDLNRLILERNKIRILQMYLAPENGSSEVVIEQVGRGEIVWIPSTVTTVSAEQTSYLTRFKARIRGQAASEFFVNHEILLSNLASYQPSLGIFHWISEDSGTIINHLSKNGVPFVVINHFHNKKLKRKMIRQKIFKAIAIAGVSAIDVPDFLRNRFTNLSDGIDIDFFHPKKALPLDIKLEEQLILLPSRICEEKGHLDAVRALGMLVRSGVNVILAFAGHEGNQDFANKLKRFILDEEVQERVIFAGELLSEDLRNWYSACAVVILPSYEEGLGRVLLEAQAMERPVVAYDVGGVREAFQDGSSGLLVRKGDISGLAIGLQNLLQDKGNRCSMGENGRKLVVSRFSLDSLVIRHERFYANALNL